MGGTQTDFNFQKAIYLIYNFIFIGRTSEKLSMNLQIVSSYMLTRMFY